jgi:DNA processing protein
VTQIEALRREAAIWLVLGRQEGVGPATLARLWRQAASAEAALAFQISNFKFEIEDKTEKIKQAETEIEKTLAQLHEFSDEGIEAIPIGSAAYPARLLDLRTPPVVIFKTGEIKPEDQRAIAIVGTRTPSKAGRHVAREIARRAVTAGFCVVSGLARGIDTEAHRSTLLAGGRTIAVVGNGLQHIYPPENQPLARRIMRKGAVISEIWPEAAVSRRALSARDRMQAALVMAVVVVQTHLGCGSLITARDAIACRRPLFAIRWEEEPYTIGLARLRQIGATIIDEAHLDEIFRAALVGKPAGGLDL